MNSIGHKGVLVPWLLLCDSQMNEGSCCKNVVTPLHRVV